MRPMRFYVGGYLVPAPEPGASDEQVLAFGRVIAERGQGDRLAREYCRTYGPSERVIGDLMTVWEPKQYIDGVGGLPTDDEAFERRVLARNLYRDPDLMPQEVVGGVLVP